MSRTRRSAAPSIAALVLLAASGCSGGGQEPGGSASGTSSATAAPSSSASPSASASATEAAPYLPVPEGVELTPPGSTLRVGDRAVLAWEPRQHLVGVLDIEVGALQRTTLKESFQGWELDKQLKDPAPYFVEATVRNVGETDLGGRQVPLYVVDGRNRLVQASRFADDFKPCPSTPLPKTFEPGDKAEVCLVYLVPDGGELTAVSFRPTEEFVPITWSGRVRPLSDDDAERPAKGADRGEGQRGPSASGEPSPDGEEPSGAS